MVEPVVNISASVSGNTDIDTNQSHQQVSFNINNKNFPITYPQTDLKIFVYQDNRRDNAVTDLQPMSILETKYLTRITATLFSLPGMSIVAWSS